MVVWVITATSKINGHVEDAASLACLVLDEMADPVPAPNALAAAPKAEPVSNSQLLEAVDHAVIARCVERQPKIYIRGQHEGYYIHSDVAALIDMIGRASHPAPASDELLDEAEERRLRKELFARVDRLFEISDVKHKGPQS